VSGFKRVWIRERVPDLGEVYCMNPDPCKFKLSKQNRIYRDHGYHVYKYMVCLKHGPCLNKAYTANYPRGFRVNLRKVEFGLQNF